MHKVHKIALDPNDRQATALARAAGCARFAYNWALARWNELYEAHKADPSQPKPNQLALRRELNAIKRERFPWMLDVTKCAPQEAVINLGKAFANFFAGRAKRPVFKKRGIHDSFKCSAGTFKVFENRIQLPVIGTLRMREPLRHPDAKLVSVTVSRTADRWFASIAVEVPNDAPASPPDGGTIGVDAGTREFVLSNGERHEVPRALRKAQRQLRRAQKALSRRKRGSRNREKARRRVARIHARAANVRADWLHKLSDRLTKTFSIVGVETLNVRGMVKNRHLSKSIMDAAFAEFRRQCDYKAAWRGGRIVVAGTFFPSSKICSACGAKTKRLPLGRRSWVCESCGTRHDRDLNAAINLEQLAVSSTVPACGEFFASGVSGSPDTPCGLDEAGTKHRCA
ncbi:MAG: transposase [Opitutaceae bacterium]|jgi:putative transposase|nr:transposase [Opitutaceae bacterium]